jgi:multidrug efflux pump subunit AcrA (membrane-fusion protein)
MVDDRRPRVNVYVEQRDVPHVRVGDLAEVTDAADSNRKVEATVARTSGQLDPRTRTLFVELEMDNSNRFLVPGSFAYVTLHVPLASYPEIPVAGLISRGTESFVAIVGDDSLVRLRPVTVANTDGIRVTLASGVKVGDHVAINLPDEVGDGSKIQPLIASR